jgi:hypothetical protein
MVDEDPIAVGETCFIDSLGSGVDDCEAAAYCVLGTPADGVCTPYCGGSPDAPVCDNPDTACALLGGVDLPLCMPTCDSDSDCGDYSTCEDRGFGQTTCIPGGY